MSSDSDSHLSAKSEATLESAAEVISKGVVSLLNTCESHGVLQGTMEEMITRAQGALMLKTGWDAWDHEKSAKDTKAGLDNNIRAIYDEIVLVKAVDPWLSIRLAKIVDPVTNLSSSYNGVLKESLKYTDYLKGSEHNLRLEGVLFEQRGRGVHGLVSTQLSEKQFRHIFQDKTQPPSIFPVLNDSTKALHQRIRSAPATFEDQSARLTPLKNILDREIHSAGGMNRGAPMLQIFHSAFKKKL